MNKPKFLTNKQTVTDILQWVLIIGLIMLSLYYKNETYNLKKDLITTQEKNTTVITFQSSEIKKLKTLNNELYQKYKNDKQVEYILQYKYLYTKDTVLKEPVNTVSKDSIQKYIYTNKTNILDYEIGVYTQKKPDSLNVNFQLNDTITVVNKKLYDNMYQTYISSQSNDPVDITSIAVYKKKPSFWSNFSVGPQIGVGYGILNKQVDAYVGVGITYKLTK